MWDLSVRRNLRVQTGFPFVMQAYALAVQSARIRRAHASRRIRLLTVDIFIFSQRFRVLEFGWGFSRMSVASTPDPKKPYGPSVVKRHPNTFRSSFLQGIAGGVKPYTECLVGHSPFVWSLNVQATAA